MNNVKFNIGDKVYCPTIGNGIYKVKDLGINHDDVLVISVGDKQHIPFNDNGVSTITKMIVVFHATEENHALLERLYGIEFEKPIVPKKPRDIMFKMFKYGYKLINYRIQNKTGTKPKYKIASSNKFQLVFEIDSYFERYSFCNIEIIDPKTGKVIVDFNSETGEVILEKEDD